MLALQDDQKKLKKSIQREKLTNLREVLITVLILSLNLSVFAELKTSWKVKLIFLNCSGF